MTYTQTFCLPIDEEIPAFISLKGTQLSFNFDRDCAMIMCRERERARKRCVIDELQLHFNDATVAGKCIPNENLMRDIYVTSNDLIFFFLTSGLRLSGISWFLL